MRCEGWRRYGGMMTLGPVTWEQCKEEAIVSIKVKQEGEISTFPACMVCWKEAINTKEIEVIEAVPIKDNLDRCYPYCQESIIEKPGSVFILQPNDYIDLTKERDQLRAENERLRSENERLRDAANSLIEALPEIAFDLGIGWTNLGTIKRRRNNMIKALNEVKE